MILEEREDLGLSPNPDDDIVAQPSITAAEGDTVVEEIVEEIIEETEEIIS